MEHNIRGRAPQEPTHKQDPPRESKVLEEGSRASAKVPEVVSDKRHRELEQQ